MSDLVKTKQFDDLIYNKLFPIINKIPDSPLSAFKLALETIEEKRKDQFIFDVLNGLKVIGIKDLEAETFLKKLYLTLQVINKAQTQEKINRFKKLLINSVIYEISSNDYELYNNIIDSISDIEFLVLNYTLDIVISNGKDKSIEKFYSQTGINKAKLHMYLQRLESQGVVKSELAASDTFSSSRFNHPVIEVTKDIMRGDSGVHKYYGISELGRFFLNFISLSPTIDDIKQEYNLQDARI